MNRLPDEPHVYYPQCGQHVLDAAIEMVKIANKEGCNVICQFNDIGLLVKPGDSPENVETCYEQASEERAEAYRNSDVGKAAAAAHAKTVANSQAMIDYFVSMLDPASDDFLDASNLAKVIRWFAEIQGHTEWTGVVVPVAKIIEFFESRGFKRNANTGIDFDENDMRNFACYLVGQALECLATVGAIHPIFITQAIEWRKRFL